MAKNNTGGLWKNKKKTKASSPEYTGQITIDGKTHYIVGWLTDGSGGKPVISIRVNDPVPEQPAATYTEVPPEYDDKPF